MYSQMLASEQLTRDIRDIMPVEILLVNKTELEATWDQLVRRYHYLGYTIMYGPRVKYLGLHQGEPIAAISFNRSALKVGVRDRFIGWDDELKQEHLKRVVCNNRFLILPWVRIPNLASHLLSQTLNHLRKDWLYLYGSKVFLVETFVDVARYSGSSYKADGWHCLGETQGFAKAGKNYCYHGNPKAVFVKVLDPDFRKALGCKRDLRPLQPRLAKGRGTEMMLAKSRTLIRTSWRPVV